MGVSRDKFDVSTQYANSRWFLCDVWKLRDLKFMGAREYFARGIELGDLAYFTRKITVMPDAKLSQSFEAQWVELKRKDVHDRH